MANPKGGYADDLEMLGDDGASCPFAVTRRTDSF